MSHMLSSFLKHTYYFGQTQLVIFGGFNENKDTTSSGSEHRAHTGLSGLCHGSVGELSGRVPLYDVALGVK
jgi:hypothetical protein